MIVSVIVNPVDAIRTGGGGGQMLITPTMTAIGQTGFSEDRSYSPEEPIRTIVSKAEQCIIAPTLIQYHSETISGEVRGQAVDQPILTLDAANRYGLAAATLIQTGYGEAEGQQPRVPHIEKPLGTIVSGGKHAAVMAFISKYYAGETRSDASDMKVPLHTITARQGQSLCTTHMCVLRNHMDGKDWREPMPTIMTSPGHFAEVRAFLVKYYGQGTGQDLKEPLDTVVSRDRFGIVTIQGTDYAIVDIGLRMLTPRELYNAQGFPMDYIIDRDYTGKEYPKSKQVARCGNSVPPPFAEALVRANLPELACKRKLDTMAQLDKEVAV
jgi:DNA (cytosine-5)-methyltransferase 1